jgi:hypothetical protein
MDKSMPKAGLGGQWKMKEGLPAEPVMAWHPFQAVDQQAQFFRAQAAEGPSLVG